MPDHRDLMQLLLISTDPARAGLLARMIKRRQLHAELCLMMPSRATVACARRAGRFRNTSPFDAILIDLTAPDKKLLAMLGDITFGPQRVPTPTVLLTSELSEAVLDSAALETGDSIMFAPTSLPSFLDKMREHSPARFLHALSRLSRIGPVLVRMPLHFSRNADELPLPAIRQMSA